MEAAKEHAIVKACNEEFDKRDKILSITSTIIQSSVYGN